MVRWQTWFKASNIKQLLKSPPEQDTLPQRSYLSRAGLSLMKMIFRFLHMSNREFHGATDENQFHHTIPRLSSIAGRVDLSSLRQGFSQQLPPP